MMDYNRRRDPSSGPASLTESAHAFYIVCSASFPRLRFIEFCRVFFHSVQRYKKDRAKALSTYFAFTILSQENAPRLRTFKKFSKNLLTTYTVRRNIGPIKRQRTQYTQHRRYIQ